MSAIRRTSGINGTNNEERISKSSPKNENWKSSRQQQEFLDHCGKKTLLRQ